MERIRQIGNWVSTKLVERSLNKPKEVKKSKIDLVSWSKIWNLLPPSTAGLTEFAVIAEPKIKGIGDSWILYFSVQEKVGAPIATLHSFEPGQSIDKAKFQTIIFFGSVNDPDTFFTGMRLSVVLPDEVDGSLLP